MATSLIGGLIADGYDASSLIASDPLDEKLDALASHFGIRTETGNADAVAGADVVVLSVKPNILKQVAMEIAPAVQQRSPLVISIAAGVRERDLLHWLGNEVALVRSMPNTPALIQAGASVLHAGAAVSQRQRNQAESILRAVGLTLWVDDEALMDAVTAISGSGPAYFFLVMELVENTAVELGLPAETARLLTLQTALGAAKMALESSEAPTALRERVTSPGGTTERAVETLRSAGLDQLFRSAITAARDRSIEISEQLGEG